MCESIGQLFFSVYSAAEMKLRNSQVLPHLRSAYPCQYADSDYTEDDLKVSHRRLTSQLEKTYTINKSNPDLTSFGKL